MKIYLVLLLIAALLGCVSSTTNNYPLQYQTDGITVKWLGHSTFEITSSKAHIFTDPFSIENITTKTVDFILISHNHEDHCDNQSVKMLNTINHTKIYGTMECVKKIKGYTNSVVQGESFTEPDYNFKITATDAYNTYHTKGDGVGYIIEIDNKKIYFAGDTDLIPEMLSLGNESIDIAILPTGGKYTMDVKEAAEAAKIIKPKVLIPMHYNSGQYGINDIDANPEDLKTALKNEDIQVVILSNA